MHVKDNFRITVDDIGKEIGCDGVIARFKVLTSVLMIQSSEMLRLID
jgi:hypothetical protein